MVTRSSDNSQQVNWVVRKNTDTQIAMLFDFFDIDTLTLFCGVYKVNGSLVFNPTVTKHGSNIALLSITDSQIDLISDQYFWKVWTTTPQDQVLINGIFTINDYLFDN